jgi:hypothetical protein
MCSFRYKNFTLFTLLVPIPLASLAAKSSLSCEKLIIEGILSNFDNDKCIKRRSNNDVHDRKRVNTCI